MTEQLTPELHINAEPDALRQMFHLAMSGVEIEYGGMEGLQLALGCALDLGVYDPLEGQALRENVMWQLYDQFEAEPDDLNHSIKGLFAAWDLAENAMEPNNLERLAYSYERAMENGILDNTEVTCGGRFSLQQALDTNDLILAAATVLDVQGVDNYTDDIRAILMTRFWGILSTTIGRPGSSLYGVYLNTAEASTGLGASLEEAYTDLVAAGQQQVLKQIAAIRNPTDTDERAAVMNAVADLRELEPESKAYKKQAKKLASHYRVNSLFFNKLSGLDPTEYQAWLRVAKGTMFDPRLIDAFIQLHRQSDRNSI